MNEKPWFDPETGLFKLDEYLVEMPSFQNILADGKVTAEELKEHAQKVTELLKELDTRLPEELRDLTTRALCELSVFYAITHLHQQQNPTAAL